MLKLPKLNFDYNSFEKYIDSETMYIHYNKHHYTYLNNSNIILNKINFIVTEDNLNLIKNLDNFPKKYLNYIKNNLGGHINHSLFWKMLGYNDNLSKDLKIYINKFFGNFLKFKEKFIKIGLEHFGSGWIWLICNDNKKLFIVTTSNQNNPIMNYKFSKCKYGYPILCLDIWEHAYYLKYRNNRKLYIESFLKILNWNYVSYRFTKCINYLNINK